MSTETETQGETKSQGTSGKPQILEYQFGVPYPPSAPPTLLENLITGIYNAITSMASNILGYLYSFISPITNRIKGIGTTLYGYFKYLISEYPIFRGFVYVFSLFSAIPIGIFLAYGAVTLAICLAIAGFGLLVVEGALLGMGLLVLAPVLFVTFWSSLFCLGAYHTIYFVASMFSTAVGKVQEVGAFPAVEGAVRTVIKEMAVSGSETREKSTSKAA